MNRRTFLGTMTAATIVARNFSWAVAEHKIEKVGIQLYTVRDILKQDFEGIVAKLAAIGYREVESGSTVEKSAKEQRQVLARHGLTATSTHRSYDELGEKWPSVLEECKLLGCRYVVIPGVADEVRHKPDGYKIAADTFNHAGEISKKAGIQLCLDRKSVV